MKMLKKVPTVRTSYTPQELIKGFVEAWIDEFGVEPKKESVGVLYAQNCLETGSTHDMWNNNIGNVKAYDDPAQTIEYCALSGVWEIVNGKRVTLTPDDPGSWFRSFPTLKDGLKFHLNFLKNKRYKVAWAAVEAGDPANFSHLLRQQGYYTAPESDYTKAVNAYFKKYMVANMFENALTEIKGPAVVAEPEVKPDVPVEHLTVEPILPDTARTLEPAPAPVEPLKVKWWQKLIDLFVKYNVMNLVLDFVTKRLKK